MAKPTLLAGWMNTSAGTLFRRGAVLLIFLAGLLLRLYDLNDAPLDFHPTRQMHSAMMARGMYYQDRADVPAWQRDLAVQQWKSEGQIEPPVMERLAVWGYGLAGEAALWIPRLWAIAFWMAAAGFVYLLAQDLAGPVAALAALCFFLFWPYGVIASRSFQPEPLLAALLAAALWAAFRWDRRVQRGESRIILWGLLSGLLAGLAIYIKPVAVFFIGPVLVVLTLRGGLRSALRSRLTWGMLLLAALPAGLYFLDGMVISGFLRQQVAERFYPQMWLDPAFYLRWISVLGRLAPLNLALLSAVGLLLLPGGRGRAALLGVWVGYVIYGLALPHHISTHDYYHLPLFPVLSLGLGAVAALVFDHLREPLKIARPLAAASLALAVVMTAYGARNELKRSDYREQVAQWQAAGEWLGAGARVVALVDDYGGGLKYWGWANPLIWPTADDLRWQAENGDQEDFAARFERMTAGQDFFLVSPLSELDSQPELAQVLADQRVAYQSADLVIYDLNQPLKIRR